jgi:acyl-CoA synthetase (AMP-forming)/AMP-acid ligase II/acyl carrier protein
MKNNNRTVPQNWIEVLEEQARTRPHQPAFFEAFDCALESANAQSISYFNLSQKAKALAVDIAKYTQFGDRVIIVMPSSIDYIVGFFACIYANVIAVTAYPPNSKKRDWSRLDTIVHDCDPAVVLHQSSQQQQVTDWLNATNTFVKPIAVDNLSMTNTRYWQYPAVDANDIVYFQYSSGSTGTPKGVMLSHFNLLSNTRLIQQNYALNEKDRIINWLPLFHDMGFVGCILTPILAGAQTWLMPPSDVARQPFTLLNLIGQVKATVTAGPNFIFDLFVAKITEQQKNQLDLSSLRVFVNGAEPINAQTLSRFNDSFAAAGLAPNALKPSYGMAEACLMVTATPNNRTYKQLSLDPRKMALGKAIAAPTGGKDMPCSGDIIPQISVKIVHQGTRAVLPDGYVGEIMIKGDSISEGYWQKPQISQTIFDNTVGKENGYMATGDLGFIDHGALYVSGRCKEMFIINGRNFYPQDIENSLVGVCDSLAPHGGALFEVATDEFNNQLVLVQELTRQGVKQIDHQALINQLVDRVSQIHELKLAAVILIKPMTLLKTSSGKIQRINCRDAYLQGQLQSVASWRRPLASDDITHQAVPHITSIDEQSITTWIVNWIAQRLAVPAQQVSAQQPLAQMGLDSIDAMTLTHDLSRQVKQPLGADLSWAFPSIQKLSNHLVTLCAIANDNKNKPGTTPMEGTI